MTQGAPELAQFLDAVETVNLGEEDRWASLLEPLRRLLRGEPLIYGVSSSSGVCRLSFLAHPRPLVRQRASVDVDVQLRSKGRFGHYSVSEVAEVQRNQPMVLAELVQNPRAWLRDAGFDRYGLSEVDQLRVILCDGATMRGWFGAFRGDDEPFTTEEVGLLGRAVPALKRRLELECHWRAGQLALSALEVALEAFGRPALIADGSGRVQHPNRLARELHAVDAVAFGESLEASRRGVSPEWSRHPLVTPGLEAHSLWVRELSLGSAPMRWPLTPRERDVLGFVVRGLSNAAIAGHLRCSERTVEAHVARVLETAQCETRAELVATVLRSAR